MAAGPSTAPQAAEKRVFQQPAGRSCVAAGAIGECEYNNNNWTIDRLFNEVNLNNLTKNLLLWLVIAIVLMSVFNNFGGRQPVDKPIEYSQFIQKVKQNEVERVVIQGRELTGRYKSGDSFRT